MAKSSTEGLEPAKSSNAAPSISLTEFCIRLSEREKRVCLIGAFEAVERAAGRLKASEDAFQTRFAAFINKPA